MEVIYWKLRNYREMYSFWEIEDAYNHIRHKFRLLDIYLRKSPDVVRKKFKESSDDLMAKGTEPADKEDVRQIKTQIQKKQESYVHALAQKIDKLTTEIHGVRNSQNEFQTRLNQWADSVNGQLRFTYAICKKADLFMKEKQSTDPFSVTPRIGAAPKRVDTEIGSPSDPFAINTRDWRSWWWTRVDHVRW